LEGIRIKIEGLEQMLRDMRTAIGISIRVLASSQETGDTLRWNIKGAFIKTPFK
jgi:hypothetical protein